MLWKIIQIIYTNQASSNLSHRILCLMISASPTTSNLYLINIIFSLFYLFLYKYGNEITSYNNSTWSPSPKKLPIHLLPIGLPKYHLLQVHQTDCQWQNHTRIRLRTKWLWLCCEYLECNEGWVSYWTSYFSEQVLVHWLTISDFLD